MGTLYGVLYASLFHSHCMLEPTTPALVCADGVRGLVVWVDGEGREGQGVEGGRVADGHIVGGSNSHLGHVGAYTTADVWNAVLRTVLSGGTGYH